MARKTKGSSGRKSGGRKFKVPTQNEILRKYGSSLQLKASTINHHGLWIPSTFFALNYQMGGGVPFGKIVEIMGEESSGKSLIAYNFAYSTQQLGGHIIWVDAEQAWMNSWAEANGLDPDRVTVLNDTRIETISDAIADLAIYYRSKLTHNEPILVVIDSIAALDSLEAIDSKMADGKAEMGNRAKQIYKMFRIRNELFYRLGVTMVCINQLRSKLGAGFGQDTNTTPGGAALKFYASIRLAFFSGKSLKIKYKGKERRAGKYVTVQMKKNKVSPPRETISKAPIYFNPKYHDVGFDRYFWLEESLEDAGVIEKISGGTYLFEGKKLCRGEEAFHRLIEEDSELRKKLLKAASINTIGTTKKKLKKITTNMFPVDEDIDYESQIESDDEEEEYIPDEG